MRGVHLEHPVERAQVDGHDRPVDRRGLHPATTLVPPPNGIAAASAWAHQASTSSTSASVRGLATTSGGLSA